MLLITHKNGGEQLIDEAPDSFEIRECHIQEVTLKMVEEWRKSAVVGCVVAQILLKKQETGDIQDLGGVNDYLHYLAARDAK